MKTYYETPWFIHDPIFSDSFLKKVERYSYTNRGRSPAQNFQYKGATEIDYVRENVRELFLSTFYVLPRQQREKRVLVATKSSGFTDFMKEELLSVFGIHPGSFDIVTDVLGKTVSAVVKFLAPKPPVEKMMKQSFSEFLAWLERRGGVFEVSSYGIIMEGDNIYAVNPDHQRMMKQEAKTQAAWERQKYLKEQGPVYLVPKNVLDRRQRRYIKHLGAKISEEEMIQDSDETRRKRAEVLTYYHNKGSWTHALNLIRYHLFTKKEETPKTVTSFACLEENLESMVQSLNIKNPPTIENGGLEKSLEICREKYLERAGDFWDLCFYLAESGFCFLETEDGNYVIFSEEDGLYGSKGEGVTFSREWEGFTKGRYQLKPTA